jgi:hypothetical protein
LQFTLLIQILITHYEKKFCIVPDFYEKFQRYYSKDLVFRGTIVRLARFLSSFQMQSTLFSQWYHYMHRYNTTEAVLNYCSSMNWTFDESNFLTLKDISVSVYIWSITVFVNLALNPCNVRVITHTVHVYGQSFNYESWKENFTPW